MQVIPKKYIVDENNNRIAVQLDLETFEKIEEILENYGLAKLMKEDVIEETLSVSEAKEFYRTLKKRNAG